MSNQFRLLEECSITYDLHVIEILRNPLHPSCAGAEIEACYANFRLRHGRRSAAAGIAAENFDPLRIGHGGWIDLMRDMGDAAATALAVLLRALERDWTLALADPDILAFRPARPPARCLSWCSASAPGH